MLLQKLILEDYSAYQNKNEFDFTCKSNKPVVLIGGLNGSGKTTILESIMVCLYGKKYLGNITKLQYYDFLRSKIYRHGRIIKKKASVSISFLFFNDGDTNTYTVERAWYISNSKNLIEEINVKKNNRTISDMDKTHWQTFVEELVPFEIAKLFFIDSEKIISMIDSSTKRNFEIHESMNSLLGLDVINRLQNDLKLYVKKNSKTELKESSIQYEKLTDEKQELERVMKSLQENLLIKKQFYDDSVSKINNLESKLNKSGGIYAKRREKLNSEYLSLKNIQRVKDKSLRFSLGTMGPFCLCPSLLKDVSLYISKDLDHAYKKSNLEFLEKHIKEKLSEISKKSFWNELKISESERKIVLSNLKCKLSINYIPNKNNLLFNLSMQDSYKIQTAIKEYIPNMFERLISESKSHLKVENELKKIESELASAPSDDIVGEIFSELRIIYEESALINSEITHIDEKISSKTFAIKIVKNKLIDTLKSQHHIKNNNTKLQLAVKLQKVLDTYIDKLLETKIFNFENNLLDTISYLLHKVNFVQRVYVDRKTFQIYLYDSENKLLSEKLLSMGEKQIICTAILWALAMISNRILPFIIDTPMARLDSEHRTRLIKNFYPTASYQMIILSTNTEITSDEYAILNSKISKSYMLVHSTKSGTRVKNGYFSKEKKQLVVS